MLVQQHERKFLAIVDTGYRKIPSSSVMTEPVVVPVLYLTTAPSIRPDWLAGRPVSQKSVPVTLIVDILFPQLKESPLRFCCWSRYRR